MKSKIYNWPEPSSVQRARQLTGDKGRGGITEAARNNCQEPQIVIKAFGSWRRNFAGMKISFKLKHYKLLHEEDYNKSKEFKTLSGLL